MDLTKQKAQTNEGMLKEAERIFDEFAKTLEKQVVSSPTENFIVDWESTFKEFVSLVKRMRNAQNRTDMHTGDEPMDFIDMLFIEQREAEREVDEYLKKMEYEKQMDKGQR
jgi:hypothetical protein